MNHETPPPSVSPSGTTSQATPTLAASRFHPGTILATPGALELMREHACSPLSLLQRHLAGDWGELCADDATLNEQALLDGSRIFSSYRIAPGVTLWVITEACEDCTDDMHPASISAPATGPAFGQRCRRSCTTILRPDDY